MADRSVNVKLKLDVAAYLAGARAASAATRDVDKAARDLRKALNEEEDAAGRVRVAEERLNEVRKTGKASASQLAAAEEDLARAHRSHEVATDRVSAANDRYVESQKKVAAESKKTTEKVDTDMSRLASRTNTQFDALKFTGLSVGLPAAAAVGVAATAGIVTAAGALFLGLGVMGARGADAVRESWLGTANVVTHGITQMSSTYETHLVAASDKVKNAFLQSAPLIEKGMVNAASGVDTLVDAGINLAENALPGVVVASGRLDPVLRGVDSLLGDVGTGFGEMAANASEGNEDARVGLVILGDTLRTTEARVGTISANFANASAGPLNSFRYTLDQVTGALVDVSSKGSAVSGFLGGFSTSTNGAITVARGLLTVVNALPPEIAQLGGAVTSTSMIMSKLGVDAGAGWDGLGGKIKAAGKELQGSEKFAAKAGTAIGGLAAGALNPAAIAVGALSLGLLVLGDHQEKAAAAAAEHRENVRSLTDAIRQDNGVLAEHSATTIANALASKNAKENLGVANITMAQATLAAQGNEKALRQVTDASNHWIQGLKGQGIESQRDIDGLKQLNQNLLENGGTYADSAQQVGQYSESLFSVNKAAADQLVHLLNGTGALGEQAKAAREAYQGYLLEQQGLTGLTESQIKARDATVDHTKAILDQQNATLGYRGAVQSTKEALDTYNKIVKDGKLGTDEGVRATLALENALSQQEQAAYNAAFANSEGKSDAERAAIATAALTQETVNLANSFAGPLPASLQQTIGKMNATQAQAAGLKLGVNNLGQAVYTLPNGHQILIESNADQQAARMAGLRDKINTIPTYHYSEVEIVTIYKTVGTAAVRTGNNAPDVYLYGPHAAAGGPVSKAPIRKFAGGGMVDIRPGGLLRGPGSGTSDSILGMSSSGMGAFSNGEYVEPASRVTPKTLPILEAIRDGRLKGYAGGGMVDAAREALGRITSGGQIFEDFSFYGNSANLSAYNDQITKMYNAWSGGADFNQNSGPMLVDFLNSFIGSSGNAVQQAIASGNAVQQAPAFASSFSGGAGASDGKFVGNLYLDSGQLLGVVRGEIRKDKRNTRRSVTTGSGGAR